MNELSIEANTPKYIKPKIMLIDIENDAETALTEAGYNITSGTFGGVYKVKPSDSFVAVSVDAELPHYKEHDIFVIDNLTPEPTQVYSKEPSVSPGTQQLWMSCNTGSINLRPLANGLC